MVSKIIWYVVLIVLVGCVIILGPSVVDVDQSIKRPVLEQNDTVIDWIDWDD